MSVPVEFEVHEIAHSWLRCTEICFCLRTYRFYVFFSSNYKTTASEIYSRIGFVNAYRSVDHYYDTSQCPFSCKHQNRILSKKAVAICALAYVMYPFVTRSQTMIISQRNKQQKLRLHQNWGTCVIYACNVSVWTLHKFENFVFFPFYENRLFERCARANKTGGFEVT